MADLTLRPEAQILDSHASSSPRAAFQKTDFTSWDDLHRLFEVADAKFGGADIVCPGAGVFEPLNSNYWQPPGATGSKSTDSAAGFGRYSTLDINITPIRMTQIAISHFVNPGSGKQKVSPTNPKRIVHIASIASEIALLSCPSYICSKWAISGFVRSLDSMEATHGIKVTAIAPGIVRTSLWTDHPEKIKFIDENVDEWVTTPEVAGAMLKLVEDPELPAGTVLEIGRRNTRPIPLQNNVGPSGPGMTLTNAMSGINEIHDWLAAPGWGQVRR